MAVGTRFASLVGKPGRRYVRLDELASLVPEDHPGDTPPPQAA